MAGNNRTTVWKLDSARGIAQWGGLALAILAIAWSQLASAQGGARLTAVEVLPMQGSTLQIRLRTDGPAPQPLTFTIDRPARLSIDLPDVSLALENRRIDVGAGGVEQDIEEIWAATIEAVRQAARDVDRSNGKRLGVLMKLINGVPVWRIVAAGALARKARRADLARARWRG